MGKFAYSFPLTSAQIFLAVNVFNKQTVFGIIMPISKDPSGNKTIPCYLQNNEKKPFAFYDACFGTPSSDPLLYLIILRDGMYFENQRIIVTEAVMELTKKVCFSPRRMMNQNTQSQDGRLFEIELHAAQTIVTHSHCYLGGCYLGGSSETKTALMSYCAGK
jgi:hypothetical protein